MPSTRTVAPAEMCTLKNSGPQIACRQFYAIRLTAIVTMIIVNSRAPRRMNGVYRNRFSRTENTAPNRPPDTIPTRVEPGRLGHAGHERRCGHDIAVGQVEDVGHLELDGEPDRRRRHHRSRDDPETDSVQEHALAPFRAGAPAGGGLTPGPPGAGGPGACAAAYLMRGASRAAVIESTRARSPLGGEAAA